MPTRSAFAADLDDSALVLELAKQMDSDDSEDEEMQEYLLLSACEPALKRLRQEIGKEKLSISRLRREAEALGIEGDEMSWNVYSRYGFHLDGLEVVVPLLNPGDDFLTRNGHWFKFGEEAVLVLLRRFRTTDPLLALTKETGRNISAISEIVQYMVEHIHVK